MERHKRQEMLFIFTETANDFWIALLIFGFIPFNRNGANLLFQLCSALYERSAIIITSNLKFGTWIE